MRADAPPCSVGQGDEVLAVCESDAEAASTAWRLTCEAPEGAVVWWRKSTGTVTRLERGPAGSILMLSGESGYLIYEEPEAAPPPAPAPAAPRRRR